MQIIVYYDMNFQFVKGDTNIVVIKDLFDELCKCREVPDIDLFINKRDFPLLKSNLTEPYDSIWGSNTKLVSHCYKKYIPILGNSKKIIMQIY